MQRDGDPRVVVLFRPARLPALEKTEDREEIAKFWGIDPEFFPKKRGLTKTDIFPAIETGRSRGCGWSPPIP